MGDHYLFHYRYIIIENVQCFTKTPGITTPYALLCMI